MSVEENDDTGQDSPQHATKSFCGLVARPTAAAAKVAGWWGTLAGSVELFIISVGGGVMRGREGVLIYIIHREGMLRTCIQVKSKIPHDAGSLVPLTSGL